VLTHDVPARTAVPELGIRQFVLTNLDTIPKAEQCVGNCSNTSGSDAVLSSAFPLVDPRLHQPSFVGAATFQCSQLDSLKYLVGQ
jgi:hypothetical protein